MSLSERLEAIRAGAATRIPAEQRAIMSQATKKLRESGILNDVIKVGDKLPAFSLPNQAGEMRASADLLAKGPMVLTVFRGVW